MVSRKTREKWAGAVGKSFEALAGRIPRMTRYKCARVAIRIFNLNFSYYRISRMKLLQTRDNLCRKVFRTMASVRRMRGLMRRHWGGVEERESGWSKKLPEEIMLLVLQRLCIQDFVRCRAVCLSWRATVDIAISSKCIRPAPQLPWLMLCPHRLSLKDTRFLSLSDQRYYKPNVSYMNRLECVGSIGVWLIMVDSPYMRPEGFMNHWSLEPWSFFLLQHTIYTTVNFFYNPLSGARVMLPSISQSTIPYNNDPHHGPAFFYQVVASSEPTSQDCLVAAIVSVSNDSPRQLAFCRLTDKSWTFITGELVFRDDSFVAIEIVDGKLYAATTMMASTLLWVSDIQVYDGSSPPKAEMLIMLEPMLRSYRNVRIIGFNHCVVHESGGECIHLARDSISENLFMIRRSVCFSHQVDAAIVPWHHILDDNIIIPPKSEGFRVFKMERKNGPRWVQVKDIGGQMLVMDKTGCKFFPASSNNRNCIFFAFDYPCFLPKPSSSRRDFGVFSLTYNRIERYAFPEDHSCSRLCDRPVWFTPDFF